MYEWLSNFKLFKVPKTLITRNPKYIKTPRKIKDIDKQGKKSGLIHYYNNECHVNLESIMDSLMFLNMRTSFLPHQD